jgi:hypothetical protein
VASYTAHWQLVDSYVGDKGIQPQTASTGSFGGHFSVQLPTVPTVKLQLNPSTPISLSPPTRTNTSYHINHATVGTRDVAEGRQRHQHDPIISHDTVDAFQDMFEFRKTRRWSTTNHGSPDNNKSTTMHLHSNSKHNNNNINSSHWPALCAYQLRFSWHHLPQAAKSTASAVSTTSRATLLPSGVTHLCNSNSIEPKVPVIAPITIQKITGMLERYFTLVFVLLLLESYG